MENIIYTIELTSTYGIIFSMKTNGTILDSEEVSVQKALSFAGSNGLAFMEDDGEVKRYW